MTIPAIDIETLNQLSYEVTQLHNLHCVGIAIDQDKIELLKSKINRFKGISSISATVSALLGSLYFISGDFKNMQFSYKIAIKQQPNNPLIRYNFISSLIMSNHSSLAREQLVEIVPYLENTTNQKLIGDTYRLLEQQLLLPQCQRVLMMIATNSDKSVDLQQWLQQKNGLLAAYQRFGINTNIIQKLLDELNSKLRPKFPMALEIQHYYEEIDNTIYYVFIDSVSSSEIAFDNCMALIEFVSDFETRHEIDLKNFVMDYEGVKQ